MYFPYFRGKQFELLALRELVENDMLSKKIIPIIEPVKLSSALSRAIELFISSDRKIIVVCNPIVGSLKNDYEMLISVLSQYFENKFFGSACILDKTFQNSIKILQSYKVNLDEISTVHINHDNTKIFDEVFTNKSPIFSLVPEGVYRRKIKGDKVLFVDRFNKKQRNVDYIDHDDEFYSDDHLYFSDEGYIGFGDYTLIGSEYSETGFLPYAVAIHLTYLDNDNVIRIKHFVSKSNGDTSNVPLKFYEALEKLVHWADENGIETHGIMEFKKHYLNKTFPGLGTVKKMSIMHHLELIGRVL